MIRALDITGLVLAGGQGRRMGGVEKGLQQMPTAAAAPNPLPHPLPLARHALARLAPQVGRLALSANRHLDAYTAWGMPVWPDGYPGLGPLAGLAAGLSRAETPWLATVPCDAPRFPLDLVLRLAEAIEDADAQTVAQKDARPGAQAGMRTSAQAAVAWSGGKPQPVFCLVHRDLAGSLQAFLGRGERRAQEWLASVGALRVDFDRPGLDDDAFFNVHTPEDLRALARGPVLRGSPL